MGNVIFSIQKEVFNAFGKALLKHSKILSEIEPIKNLKLTAMAKSLLRISIAIVTMMQYLCKGLKRISPGNPGFVRIEGLEPPRLSALDPKSSAATNYAISAKFRCKVIKYF